MTARVRCQPGCAASQPSTITPSAVAAASSAMRTLCQNAAAAGLHQCCGQHHCCHRKHRIQGKLAAAPVSNVAEDVADPPGTRTLERAAGQ